MRRKVEEKKEPAGANPIKVTFSSISLKFVEFLQLFYSYDKNRGNNALSGHLGLIIS